MLAKVPCMWLHVVYCAIALHDFAGRWYAWWRRSRWLWRPWRWRWWQTIRGFQGTL